MERPTPEALPVPDQVIVERAIAEIRAGRPVLVEEKGTVLVAAAEALDAELAARFDAAAPGLARLALPAPRLNRLGAARSEAGTVALPDIDPRRVQELTLLPDGRIDAPVSVATRPDEDALELLRLALVLPAALVAPASAEQVGPVVLRVAGAAIRGFRHARARSVRIVGRAPVPLDGAKGSEFVVFRGGEGLREQVAVVVDKPDLAAPVAVRLHSACLTGDLFGSLKCDCGDQLRRTVRWMAENGGGVVLYLDQEGRGTGIANKMRAYELQASGLDTYDADEALGFGPDQRRFDFAAEMLKQLGVTQVRVMTNNPEKIAALRAAGLDVAADARIVGRQTAENLGYLTAKRDRGGHLLDFACATSSPVGQS